MRVHEADEWIIDSREQGATDHSLSNETAAGVCEYDIPEVSGSL
jgi:hypothetical protein